MATPFVGAKTAAKVLLFFDLTKFSAHFLPHFSYRFDIYKFICIFVEILYSMLFREKIASAHPFWKGMLWLGLMVVCFIVLMVGLGVYIGLTGNQSVMQLRIEMLLQTFVLFGLPALLVVALWSKHPAEWLHLRTSGGWLPCLLAFLLMVVAQPGINLLAKWNESWQLPAFLASFEEMLKQMEDAAREATELLAQAPTFGIMLFNLVVMALLPALCEELSFRGVLLGLLDGNKRHDASPSLSRRTHLAIWATGIIFSLIHFQFYGFVPRMLLGVVLGYLLAWTGSLWVPVIAHFANNAFVVVLYFLEEHTQINADSVDSFGTGTTAWVGVVSLVAACAILWLVRSVVLKRSSAPRQAAPEE